MDANPSESISLPEPSITDYLSDILDELREMRKILYGLQETIDNMRERLLCIFRQPIQIIPKRGCSARYSICARIVIMTGNRIMTATMRAKLTIAESVIW